MKKSRKVWHVFAFIAVFAAAIAIVMLLWNALIPSIIGWSSINYWQAAGLMILSRLLLSGFRGPMHGHGPGFGKHQRKEHFRLHEKLKGMSKDERMEYIREHMQCANRFKDKENRPSENESEN